MPLNIRQLVSSYEDSSSQPKLDVEAVETRSIRFSGLLALILGFVSILSILSYYLAFIPAAAVFFACVARRPFKGIEPEGFRSALYGFLLAIFFLFWTLVENYCSHSALGRRGAEFAERWLRLIDQGDLEFVVELATHPTRRQATMMSLVDYYKSTDGVKAVKNFRNNAVTDQLMSGAANRLWKAVKPPVVFNIGSRKMVTTFWRDESSPNAIIISVLMECIKSDNPSATQWMVETVDKLSEGPAELPLITR